MESGLLHAQNPAGVHFLRAPKHPVYHPFSSGPLPSLPQTARVVLISLPLVLSATVLAARRIASGIPFFPPADYRSFTIFNRRDFLYLYDEAELPSKAPVEDLVGARRIWSYLQLACAVAWMGIGIAGAVGGPREILLERIVELVVGTMVVGLLGFRLYPTPYRPVLGRMAVWSTIISLILLAERELSSVLLTHAEGNVPWETWARLGVMSGVLLAALLSPRVWYPVDPYSEDVASPEQTASWYSYIMSYDWIQPVISMAWKQDMVEENLPKLPDYDKAKLWHRKYEENRRANALRTVGHLFRLDFFTMTACSILVGLMQFITPMAMRGLLSYVEGSHEPVVSPWVYVIALTGGPVLVAIAYQGYIFNATRLIIRVKGAFTQALLQKTLLLRLQNEENAPAKDEKGPSGVPKKSRVGMINNLMSSDLMTLTDARDIFVLLGTVPIEIVLALFFLYDLLAWASLIGVALMVMTMFVPVLLARFLAKIQKRLRAATDARVGLMSETLNSIRAVKYFGLEKPFLGRIKESRDKEMGLMVTTAVFNLSFHTISTLLPIVNMIVTFGIYTIIMKQPLTPSIAFTSISLFDILRRQFRWLSFVAQLVLNSWVSFERVDKFLHEEEELEPTSKFSTDNPDTPPFFKDATISWCIPGTDGDNNFRLQNLNFECAQDGLTVIAGAVGSGKSSILLGLLGEMRILSGQVHLPRQHGVSYAAQTPWLQCDTVRKNILFGSEFDQERYQKVVHACGLEPDFKKLEFGDQTEIGEKGVTLSGGQKQRVALARAVYSSAKTVLLDDVLSALDASTAKHVYEHCLKGDILAGRTVVLVTHHLSLVAPSAKKIVVLNDGQVVSDGPPSALQADLRELLEEAPEEEPQQNKDRLEHAIDNPDPAPAAATEVTINGQPSGKLIKDEEYSKGGMPISLIWKYLRYLGNPFVIIFLILLAVLDQLGGLLNQFFVGLWSDEYTKHPDTIDIKFWLAMYALVLIGTSVFDTVTYGIWYCFQWFAARRLHEGLVAAVIYSPIRFFDTTPIGRVINRLSNDVRAVDSRVGPYLQQVVNQVLEVVFRLFVMSGLIPAFLAPTVVACIFGVTCGFVYSRAQISVKRIMSVKESPLMSHFGDTIAGILTIRAFGSQDRFLEENLKRTDAFNRPSETYYNLNRWIAIRISWCTALVGGTAGVIAVTSKGYSAGLIGFSMTNALAFAESVLYGVRYWNSLEMEMNSFERMEEWVHLPRESIPAKEREPPAAWPTEGDVQIRELSVRYSKETPEVLNKITFDVKSGERIGVVGRTGAGKSSLALSILGFTDITHGSIFINGLDIQQINREALRRRVTIIPQDPILFSGTIRTNLDPFNELDNTYLQSALEGCGLAGVSESTTPNGSGSSTPSNSTKRITLDTPVTSGGDNLSQGQRQLLAFGRAIVRNSKLLILDEATSSTDFKTDEYIRRTLETNPSFLGSSLILIAHRLRTVMNFDRILVLDNVHGKGGEVVEFDTPERLLSDKNGVLYALAKKSGEFEELWKMATEEKGR